MTDDMNKGSGELRELGKTHEGPGEDRLGAMLEPDTLLPVQYYDRLRRRADCEGERRLMIAILEDAVDVYRKHGQAHDRKRQNLFRDAEAWFESEDRTWFYSFENICDVLGLDASYLRHGLRAFRRGKSADAKRIAVMDISPMGTPEPARAVNGS